MPATGLPDVGYILRAASRAKAKYQGRDSRIEGVRDRRWNRGKGPDIPKKFQKTTKAFRSPLTRDLLKRGQSIIGDTYPDPSVTPLDVSSTKGQKNAELRANWLRAAYKKMDRHGHPRVKNSDAIGADGESILKCYLRVDRWGGAKREDGESPDDYLAKVDKTHKQNFPFVLEHVETTSFLPLAEDLDGYCEVVQHSLRETYPLLEKYGSVIEDWRHLGPPLGSPDYGSGYWGNIPDTVETYEYWNRTHYAFVVQNTIVESGEHHYPRIPFFRAVFSGTSSSDPEFATEGLADPLMQLQDRIEELRTIQLNWAFLNGFPVSRFRPATEDAIELDPTLQITEWEPGETINPVGGNVWEWVPAPGVGADITHLGEYFEAQADKVSLAPILYGQINGDLSGPAAQSLISLARGVFGPAMQSLIEQWDDIAAFMQESIETVLKEDVPVEDSAEGGWITLGPEDIKGYYQVSHELAPLTALETMSKSIWLSDAQARGVISMRHLREEGYGLKNPAAMAQEVKVEKMSESQEYQSLLMQKFTERIVGPPPPVTPQGTPEAPPVGPGGIGIPQIAGVQQQMLPGMGPEMGGVMAEMPQPGMPMGDPNMAPPQPPMVMG